MTSSGAPLANYYLSAWQLFFSFAGKITVMIVISLIPLLILGFMLWNLFSKKARVRRVIKNGVEANAVLLNIDYTSIKTEKLVRLQIQVYPKTGRNFVADIPGSYDASNPVNYHIGDLLLVKYNPFNTKEIVIISGR